MKREKIMKTNMRKSRVLEKLRSGGTAFSFKLNFSCARVAELVSIFGFDCVWADSEHVANDWSILEKQVWAAKTNDTDVMVRVSRGSYSDYIKPLELDAAGIMVPHVMNGAEAEEIARMTRFHPLGRRPVDGGNADSKFLKVEMEEYLSQANRERFVALQIEDPEAMENLDEIARTEGIDMLFFGPGDYSHALGLAGEFEHPEIEKARRLVASAAERNGKFAGTVGNTDNLEELAGMGYRFLNVGSDAGAMGKALGEIAVKLGN